MDTPTVQRVRSHGASIDRHAFEIADRFLDGFFARCSALGPRPLSRRFRGTPEAQRRVVAQRWAWFVRNLGQLERATPELEALATFLSARGVTGEDVSHGRAAMLEALRDTSGPSWNTQIETDWNAAIDAAVKLMFPASNHRMSDAPAYAMAA